MYNEYSIHNSVQDAVVNILRFYGFTARTEAPARIPEGGMGRTDVVGQKSNTSVGVEVVDTGDVARDANKLAMNNYDYCYIITLSPSKTVDEVVVNGKRIKVLPPELFEHELRRDLGIPPDHPYYFSQEIEKPPEVFVEGTNEVDKVIDELQDYGLENFSNEVLDAIRRIYISGNLTVEVRVHYNPMTGPTAPNEYESANIKPQIVSILQRLNLITITREGTGYHRKGIAVPTERGRKVGHELILKAIEEHKPELNELIRRYGDKLWTILYGSLWYNPPIYVVEYVIAEEDSIFKPKAARNLPRDDPIIEAAKRTRLLGRYNVYDLEYMPLQDEVAQPPVILLFSRFLVDTALREDTLRFFRELEQYGLAIVDTEYDSKGTPLYRVYKAPLEIFQYFITRTKAPGPLGYYAQRFVAFYVLLNVQEIVHPETARKVYDEMVRLLEIPDKLMAEILADMNHRGITSRLITDPTKAPFIILDEKRFKDYIKYELTTIAEHFK
ncbi:hypothetical protein E3E29_06850 [Thermococcus sp. Bubb.Bath]|nr:hypothetical protein [Thermococcus sp. Bubb.Bath]